MIPEAAGKLPYTFIVGSLFPAVLMMSSFVFYDELLLHYTGRDGKSLDWATLATAIFLASIGLAGFLMTLNFFIIRVLEGKIGMPAALARRRRDSWVMKFRNLNKKINAATSIDEAYRLEQQLNLTFPYNEEDIRPTRLGNVIAAWESYPFRRYGIDGIVLWPRLTPVLSKPVVDAITGTKAKFDLFLNILILLPTWGLLHATVLRQANHVWGPLLLLALTVAFTPLIWQACIAWASAWGETVKAAFDLHRFDVLQQMGVADCLGPLSAEQEKAVWQQVVWPMKYARDSEIHVQPRRPRVVSAANGSEREDAEK